MQRVYITFIILTLLGIFAFGCSFLKEPPLSENFAVEGESDVPQLVDGSMYTTGETQRQYSREEGVDDSRFSEALITLKKPRSIRKIVVRRRPEHSVPVDIDVVVMRNGEWKTIKEVRGEVADDIEINVSTVTDQVKIKAQRATRTAKGKSGLAMAGGGARRTEMERLLREPIKLAEIELYGYLDTNE
ncbi:hypothetical protein GF312_02235 [Candidatus Poribacteria bacterium]|nr:hypothetical protein [Candidatus Poribacteria bacterium]